MTSPISVDIEDIEGGYYLYFNTGENYSENDLAYVNPYAEAESPAPVVDSEDMPYDSGMDEYGVSEDETGGMVFDDGGQDFVSQDIEAADNSDYVFYNDETPSDEMVAENSVAIGSLTPETQESGGEIVVGQQDEDSTSGGVGDVLAAGGEDSVIAVGDTIVGYDVAFDKEIYNTTGDTLNDIAGNDNSNINENEIQFEPIIYNTINGTDDTDWIILYSGNNNAIYGYDNWDVLAVVGNENILYGGNGNDFIESDDGYHNILYGDAGDDLLYSNVDNSCVLIGGVGDDTLNCALSTNDTFNGGEGDDLYTFNSQSLNNMTNTITDSNGNDAVLIGFVNYGTSRVDYNDSFNVALYMDDSKNLVINYDVYYHYSGLSEDNEIIIKNQTTNPIEKLVRFDNQYLTNTDINQIIQSMNQYAADHGFTISSVEDVKSNADLMNIINSAWHS